MSKMLETVRGRLGDDPHYLPAQGEKKQVAYVSLAETPRYFDEQQQDWVDGETRWYEATFTGADADYINEQYEKGDAIIASGQTVRESNQLADGRVFKKTRLYVEAFGPDPRFMTMTFDRSARQARQQAPTQEATQEATQTQSAAPGQGVFDDMWQRVHEARQDVAQSRAVGFTANS